MLFPQQVLPFLGHADWIVRNQVGRYFRDTYDFGPLTADDYWGVIDRLGKTQHTLGFAADLSDLPQTDASVDRLIGALALARSADSFTFHFQRTVRNLDMGILSRNRGKLLECPHLSEDVRKHLELRLSLVDEPAMSAWDQLMEHGRELGQANVGEFQFSLSDALIEAAARGGDEICARAISMMADESACEDWREIFSVKTLGLARREPATEALVNKYAVDADVLREEVTRALSRIGTPEVVDRIAAFYPGKKWDIRLFACDPLANIKRAESEVALLKLLEVEIAIEAHPTSEDEGEPLTDHLLHDLLSLCSLAGLEQSLDQIARFPGGSMWGDLRQDLLAVSIMNGVSLPEEAEWRKLIEEEERESISRRAMFDAAARNLSTEPKRKAPKAVVDHNYEPGPVAQIRNAGPKIGRNDTCPCGSGKKYKKCCGKK